MNSTLGEGGLKTCAIDSTHGADQQHPLLVCVDGLLDHVLEPDRSVDSLNRLRVCWLIARTAPRLRPIIDRPRSILRSRSGTPIQSPFMVNENRRCLRSPAGYRSEVVRFLDVGAFLRSCTSVRRPHGRDAEQRLVHGSVRSAHATNRPDDAVGKLVEASKLMTAFAPLRDPHSTQSRITLPLSGHPVAAVRTAEIEG